MIRFFPSANSVKNEKRPSGRWCSPKGRIFCSKIRAGIPAPPILPQGKVDQLSRTLPLRLGSVKAIRALVNRGIGRTFKRAHRMRASDLESQPAEGLVTARGHART